MEKQESGSFGSESKVDQFADASEDNPAAAQLLGVMILEFGVIFHSLIIGLTLAVTGSDSFNILFIARLFPPQAESQADEVLYNTGHHLSPDV